MITPKTLKYIVVLVALVTLLPITSLADAPYERYHVPAEEISKTVLKETIGIVTINSGIKKGKELKTYKRDSQRTGDNQFQPDRKLVVNTDTIPISNFGYQPSDELGLGIESYRFPIVAKSGKFVCIVFNPAENWKAWIDLDEVEKDFYTVSVVMLNRIEIPSSFFVDIFYFTANGERKLYEEPNKASETTVIKAGDPKLNLLKIIDQKGGFIKIGAVHVEDATLEESVAGLGWIRIRDEDGALTIWINDVDVC